MVPPRALGPHSRVGLDTSLFIYDWENHSVFGGIAHQILSAVESGALRGVVSTLLFAELLVVPMRAGREDLVARYLDRLVNFPNLTITAPGPEICLVAARVRATMPRVRLADAIHIATATHSGATAFITNDLGIESEVGLAIVHLSDSASLLGLVAP